MKDRFQWCDNFGCEFPKPLGFGLEAHPQEREFGEDLFKVQDPERPGAWIVSDTTQEVEN